MRDQGTRPSWDSFFERSAWERERRKLEELENHDLGDEDRSSQAELASAATRYSTAAGAKQAPLESPLTAAELAGDDGYGVGITDVDCTPRPRYGESQARFEARMQGYGVELGALRRAVAQRNRKAALKSQEAHTGEQFPLGVTYWTMCACGFCGLKVGDPEVARREYDTHVCAVDGAGDAAVDRAQAYADKATMPAKRTTSVMQPSLPSAMDDAMRELDRAAEYALDELRNAPTKYRGDDEAAKRFALLEGIPK